MIVNRLREKCGRSAGAILFTSLVGAVAIAGCSAAELSADVRRQLDVPGSVLAGDAADQPSVPQAAMTIAANRVSEAGTELRVVVFSDDEVSASAVVERYGGLALAYDLDTGSVEAASNDMKSAQLNRVRAAAAAEIELDASVTAVADVIASEGLQRPGRSIARWMLLMLLFGAPIAAIAYAARSDVQARRRAQTRHAEFAMRRDALHHWTTVLRGRLERFDASSASPSGAEAALELRSLAVAIAASVEGATSVAELDVSEMRLSSATQRLQALESA